MPISQFSLKCLVHDLTYSQFCKLSQKTKINLIPVGSWAYETRPNRAHLLACLQAQLSEAEESSLGNNENSAAVAPRALPFTVPKSAYYYFCSANMIQPGSKDYNEKIKRFIELNRPTKTVADAADKLLSLLLEVKLTKSQQFIKDWISDANIFLHPFGQELVQTKSGITVGKLDNQINLGFGFPYERSLDNWDASFVEELKLEGATHQDSSKVSLTKKKPVVNKSLEPKANYRNDLPVQELEFEPTTHQDGEDLAKKPKELGFKERARQIWGTYKLGLISGTTVAIFMAYKFLSGKKSTKKV